MRSIGTLPHAQEAHRLSEILEVNDIPHRVDPDERGDPEIWIVGDEHLQRARELKLMFEANPADPSLVVDAALLKQKRRDADRERRAHAGARFVDVRTQVWHGSRQSSISITGILIVIAAVPFLLSFSDAGRPLLELLFYSFPHDRSFAALREFQIWRLITPIFVHFGIFHFLFNMFWLRDLGASIEGRSGGRYLLVFVLALAVLSNTGQYWTSGASFGGMSGVVYGLFGYVWMRARYQPQSGLALADYAPLGMMMWYFACVFGIVGRIANMAHGVGLIVGMLWGLYQAGALMTLPRRAVSHGRDRWVLLVLLLALPCAYWADSARG